KIIFIFSLVLETFNLELDIILIKKKIMKWFEEFIEETRELWQKQKEDTISKIMEDIDLLLEELTSKEKGDIGEEHVEELLANREFYTVITKRSQTPSDVTGLRVYK